MRDPAVATAAPQSVATVRERFRAIGVAQLSDVGGEYVRVLRLALTARTRPKEVCGPLFPVETDNDMLPCLQALASAPAGAVVYIKNRAEESEALVGDIFATAAHVQGLGGIVVDGAVRDLADLGEMEIPVFSTSVTFLSARTTTVRALTVPHSVRSGGTTLSPGEWLFGDPDGFLVVPAEHANALLLGGRLLRDREESLKDAIRRGEPFSKITGLDGFLAGSGPLGFVP
jgi:4-hydroxy-4-methyl-2-oxoglutarate aldolase